MRLQHVGGLDAELQPLASVGSSSGLLAEICFIPLCQIAEADEAPFVHHLQHRLAVVRSLEAVDGGDVLEHERQVEQAEFEVNGSNIDSDGAANCTSPSSMASSTLSSL